MKTIPLSRGEFSLIDDEDFERVTKFKWSLLKNGTSGYAVRSTVVGYRSPDKPKGDSKNQIHKMSYLSHFILNLDGKFIVDHIDGNKLNNQKHNLRIVTKSQNAMNSKVRSDNKSGVRGVNWDKIHNKWRARVKVDGKEVFCINYGQVLSHF